MYKQVRSKMLAAHTAKIVWAVLKQLLNAWWVKLRELVQRNRSLVVWEPLEGKSDSPEKELRYCHMFIQ